jgi:hypothetical protein
MRNRESGPAGAAKLFRGLRLAAKRVQREEKNKGGRRNTKVLTGRSTLKPGIAMFTPNSHVLRTRNASVNNRQLKQTVPSR